MNEFEIIEDELKEQLREFKEYRDWLGKVNKLLLDHLDKRTSDFPKIDWMDYFHWGETPVQAVKRIPYREYSHT